MFSVSGSMLEIDFMIRRCVLKDSERESENLSLLVGLSVSNSQKSDSSNGVSFIGI